MARESYYSASKGLILFLFSEQIAVLPSGSSERVRVFDLSAGFRFHTSVAAALQPYAFALGLFLPFLS